MIQLRAATGPPFVIFSYGSPRAETALLEIVDKPRNLLCAVYDTVTMKKQHRTVRPATRRGRRPPTIWHLPFGALVEQRCPAWIKVALEALLQRESQRIDQVYTLRAHRTRNPSDEGTVLRGLWKYIHVVGIAEFKSLSAPVAPGDVERLGACGWHWLSKHPKTSPNDVVLVLIVASITPTLREEIALCNTSLEDVGNGYFRACVAALATIVVVLDDVAEAEQDDWLRAFGHTRPRTSEVIQWLRGHTNILENEMYRYDQLKGHDDMVRKIAESIPAEIKLATLTVEERLAGIATAERLAGIATAERLAGIATAERLAGIATAERLAGVPMDEIARVLPEHYAVLALPIVALRGLSQEYIQTLPQDVQDKIRERIVS
jgi:hypothetical protein